MERMLFFLLVLAACCLPAHANGPLDNAGVLAMVRLGLDAEIIRARIDSGPTRFDVGNEALAELQQAGVPASLVAAMVSASGRGPAPATDNGSGATFLFGPDDRPTPIPPTRVQGQMSRRKSWIPYYGAFAAPEMFLFLSGRHAAARVPQADQQFLTSVDPLHLRLVRLGLHKRRQDRFIVFQGDSSDREVAFETQRASSGLYRLVPQVSLKPGEYAFLYQPAAAPGSFWSLLAHHTGAAHAFDFSVPD